MGIAQDYICKQCGKVTNISKGGGFSFHLLRCNECGKTKSVNFQKIDKLHQQYIKGLPSVYCVASTEHDTRVQSNPDIEEISEDNYHKQIEIMLEKCKCGGSFKFDAPPRCKKCRSTDLETLENGDIILYD